MTRETYKTLEHGVSTFTNPTKIARSDLPVAFDKLPSNVECDFCSKPEPPTRRYPAEDFEMLVPGRLGYNVNSIGDWGACAECAALIDAERWDELEERAVKGYEENRAKRCPKAEQLDDVGREVVAIALHDAYAKFRQHRKRKEMATQRVLVKAQNVHDYFLAHHEEHGWDDLRTFFAIRPPFPEMVVSYDHEMIDPKDAARRRLRHVDVLVTERTREYFSHHLKAEARVDAKGQGELRDFVDSTQPATFLEIRVAVDTTVMPGRWFLFLDEHGKVLTRGDLGWVFIKDPEEDALLAEGTRSAGRDMQDWVTGVVGKHGAIACAVLQFMNCRNVEVVDNAPTRQQRRAAERSGKRPPVTYKTLVIHPLGKKRATAVTVPATGIEMSLHICRGHFKRFAEDGPGLGKHHAHGVWWWSPQVRGSAAVGRVEKDYDVEAAT